MKGGLKMKFVLNDDPIDKIEVDTIIFPFWEGDKTLSPNLKIIDERLNKTISSLIERGYLTGEFKEIKLLYTLGRIKAEKVLIVGMGKKNEITLERLRIIAASVIKYLYERGGVKIIAIGEESIENLDFKEQIVAWIEGLILGGYRFEKYRTSPSKITPLAKIVFVGTQQLLPILQEGVYKGRILAEATNWARDLINEPANRLTPRVFSMQAQEIAKKFNLELTILQEQELEELGMGAFLAVARGSYEVGRLIVIKYTAPKPDAWTLGLVGKGVTFDSGGISIKKGENLYQMLDDKGGAAVVLSVIQAVAQLNIKNINVLGVIPVTENLLSGRSYRPGDILKSFSGKTIQVITTDAEGRLLLADALYYAHKLGAAKLIDIATLTGGCKTALGKFVTGIMGNSPEFLKQLKEAAEEAGERVWELPLFPEYQKLIESDIADLKNYSGKDATTITAAKFLENFVAGKPWIHIDIAGTVITERCPVLLDKGYIPEEGATGVMVRTLIRLIKKIGEGKVVEEPRVFSPIMVNGDA